MICKCEGESPYTAAHLFENASAPLAFYGHLEMKPARLRKLIRVR